MTTYYVFMLSRVQLHRHRQCSANIYVLNSTIDSDQTD